MRRGGWRQTRDNVASWWFRAPLVPWGACISEYLGALDVELTPGDMQRIEEASAGIRIHGARVPERLQAQLGR